jgi:predicted Zn-dependent peptidase
MSHKFQKKKFGNGLTLLSKKIEDVEWQLVGFVVHAGASADFKSKEGVAHFVEHMVSANHSLDTALIKDFFRQEGGMIMLGSTGFFSTEYGFKLPNDSEILKKGFLIMKELLFDITFKKNIERERKIIQSEFHGKFPSVKMKKLKRDNVKNTTTTIRLYEVSIIEMLFTDAD